MIFLKKLTPFTLPFLLAACGNDDIDPSDLQTPDVYEFSSLTDSSAISSVEYKEVITRHILINELNHLLGSEYLQEIGATKGRAAVLELLNRIYTAGTGALTNNLVNVNLYNDQSEATPINGTPLQSGLIPLQTTFADLSPNINLRDAMPGLAYDLPFRDENNSFLGEFIGWDINDVNDEDLLPDAMIQSWFNSVATLASDDDDTTTYYENNFNYRELIVQFLSSVLFYPQAATFHLNEQQGLFAENINISAPYTELQHQWDLAFAHYGFARDTKTLGPNKVSEQADYDNNGDGSIDLYSEYSFNFSRQAALKDIQATFVDTNYSSKTIQAFLTGRQLIDLNYIDSSQVQNFRSEINIQANIILDNWENSLAATMVQSINLLSQSVQFIELDPDLEKIYATQWAKLKATTMGFQFNNNSQFSVDNLKAFHDYIGKTPIKNRSIVTYYLTDLFDARLLLQAQFNISEDNVNAW